jgi:hypothetical protein
MVSELCLVSNEQIYFDASHSLTLLTDDDLLISAVIDVCRVGALLSGSSLFVLQKYF